MLVVPIAKAEQIVYNKVVGAHCCRMNLFEGVMAVGSFFVSLRGFPQPPGQSTDTPRREASTLCVSRRKVL